MISLSLHIKYIHYSLYYSGKGKKVAKIKIKGKKTEMYLNIFKYYLKRTLNYIIYVSCRTKIRKIFVIFLNSTFKNRRIKDSYSLSSFIFFMHFLFVAGLYLQLKNEILPCRIIWDFWGIIYNQSCVVIECYSINFVRLVFFFRTPYLKLHKSQKNRFHFFDNILLFGSFLSVKKFILPFFFFLKFNSDIK